MGTFAGVDGCPGGWICVTDDGLSLRAVVVPAIAPLLAELPEDSIVAIDIPIGLTEAGPRQCDLAARRLLRAPRASSVFPAPVRPALQAATYAEACAAHRCADGRSLSRQAFGILSRIREIDALLVRDPARQARIREAHPEVCFAVWNGGRPTQFAKRDPAGRLERENLIDAAWPGARLQLLRELRGTGCKPDDLNDAFATLWTARRIGAATTLVLPDAPPLDACGLRMEIVA